MPVICARSITGTWQSGIESSPLLFLGNKEYRREFSDPKPDAWWGCLRTSPRNVLGCTNSLPANREISHRNSEFRGARRNSTAHGGALRSVSTPPRLNVTSTDKKLDALSRKGRSAMARRPSRDRSDRRAGFSTAAERQALCVSVIELATARWSWRRCSILKAKRYTLHSPFFRIINNPETKFSAHLEHNGVLGKHEPMNLLQAYRPSILYEIRHQ